MTDSPLISTEALAQALVQGALHGRSVCLFDATYFVPPDPRVLRETFEQAHLPGARYFDIEALSDATSPLPHMLAAPAVFAEAVSTLGLSNADAVVVYDQHGLMTAPRAWWMLRVYGHDAVWVLDGGLPKWQREERPIETGPAKDFLPTHFQAGYRPELVADRQAVAENNAQVLDARSAVRFQGLQSEPRPGLRAGHILGSHNVPWADYVDPETHTLCPVAVIRERLSQAGIDPMRPVINTCGSGVTACMGALALYLVGQPNALVYDGSWAEWGQIEAN